eukprot:259241_1
MTFVLIYFLSFIWSINCALYPGGSIINNTQWLDTDGNFIHAHGGQIFQYNNLFYWIGTTQKVQPNYISEGINCYSSNNLMDWKFENMIFVNTSALKSPVTPPFRIERPKILYNNKTSKFVMWFKLKNYASNEWNLMTVCISDTVCGHNSYQFIDAFEPDGMMADDLGLFIDDDGTTAYFVRNANKTFAGISILNDQYTNTTSAGIISRGPHIEAPAIFKLDTYYLLGSHLTGWKPNAQELCVTNNIQSLNNAKWDNDATQCPNPTSSSTTYNSQTTFVLRLTDYKNDKYVFMYMGDIWHNPNISKATYIWLPLVFNNNNAESRPVIPDKKQWTIKDYNVSIPT